MSKTLRTLALLATLVFVFTACGQIGLPPTRAAEEAAPALGGGGGGGQVGGPVVEGLWNGQRRPGNRGGHSWR